NVNALKIKRITGRGRLHLALAAREQAHAELILQLTNVLRNARLRRTLTVRRPGERALLVNGDKKRKVAHAAWHWVQPSAIVIALRTTYYFAECTHSTYEGGAGMGSPAQV